MKKEVHNALMAALRAGPYHECKVNTKTGQMTIETAPIKPNGVVVKEIGTGYQMAKLWKRGFNVSEITRWSWVARVEFPATEVSCEAFEELITTTGIEIPPPAGETDLRPVLVRLAQAEYSHPPEQSPNQGTVVEFLFEVLPETLRK